MAIFKFKKKNPNDKNEKVDPYKAQREEVKEGLKQNPGRVEDFEGQKELEDQAKKDRLGVHFFGKREKKEKAEREKTEEEVERLGKKNE